MQCKVQFWTVVSWQFCIGQWKSWWHWNARAPKIWPKSLLLIDIDSHHHGLHHHVHLTEVPTGPIKLQPPPLKLTVTTSLWQKFAIRVATFLDRMPMQWPNVCNLESEITRSTLVRLIYLPNATNANKMDLCIDGHILYLPGILFSALRDAPTILIELCITTYL